MKGSSRREGVGRRLVAASRVATNAARDVREHKSALFTGPGDGRTLARVADALTAAALTGEAPAVDALRAYSDVMGRLDAEQQYLVGMWLQDLTVVALWEQDRTVYVPDASLWDALAASDLDTVIPGEVLRRIPHRNPFLLMPEQVETRAANGDVLRTSGVWICGIRTTGVGDLLCSTADPRCDRLLLTFHSVAVDSRGEPIVVSVLDSDGAARSLVDTAVARFRIEVADMSLADRVTQVTGRWHELLGHPATSQQTGLGLDADTLSRLVAAVLSTLTYVCSGSPDVAAPVPVPAGRKRGRRRGDGTGDTAAQVVDVGARVGAALRADGVSRRTLEPGSPTGRTVAGHVRRGHWHRYRHGPRADRERQWIDIRWLPPIPVNLGPGETATRATVHRVVGPGGG